MSSGFCAIGTGETAGLSRPMPIGGGDPEYRRHAARRERTTESLLRVRDDPHPLIAGERRLHLRAGGSLAGTLLGQSILLLDRADGCLGLRAVLAIDRYGRAAGHRCELLLQAGDRPAGLGVRRALAQRRGAAGRCGATSVCIPQSCACGAPRPAISSSAVGGAIGNVGRRNRMPLR